MDAEHRRLSEKWILQGLSDEEIERVPPELMDRVRAHFRHLVDPAVRDTDAGRVTDGPAAMERLRGRI